MLLLPVNEGYSRDRVIVIVVVLVPALDELLLCLFETKGTHKPLPIT